MTYQTGKRLVLMPDGSVQVESYEVPSPAANQILVRVSVSQVSAGSEINGVRRRRQATAGEQQDFAPSGMGYTTVGQVEAVGDEITDFAPGDRVLCNGNHGTHWLVTPASAQDPVSISQQYMIEKLPAAIDDVHACFAILGDVTLHGVRMAQLQLGESVAVHGLGVIGQIAMQLCRLSGAHPVIGVDLVQERLRLAQELGAELVVDASQNDVAEAVRALTPRVDRWRGALPGLEPDAGADVQLHCTSVIKNYPDLIKAAADRGRIILVGATSGSVEIESQELFRREITIRGSYQTGMVDPHPYWPWTRARNRRVILDLIAREQLNVAPLVSHVVPYAEAPALYDQMMEGGTGWMSVFFRWDEL